MEVVARVHNRDVGGAKKMGVRDGMGGKKEKGGFQEGVVLVCCALSPTLTLLVTLASFAKAHTKKRAANR